MDSKKPSVFQHLRKKMTPHLRRGRNGPHHRVDELKNGTDIRASASVPDMRNLGEQSAGISSSPRHRHRNVPSYSNPSTPLIKPNRGWTEGGSGLNTRAVSATGAGRNENRLNVPSDTTDWASLQGSFPCLCDTEKDSLEKNYSTNKGMEPEETYSPEMTAYGPDSYSAGGSQDGSQVGEKKFYIKYKHSLNVIHTIS